MMASAGVRRKLSRYNVLYREGATATCFSCWCRGPSSSTRSTLSGRSPHWAPGSDGQGATGGTRHLRCAKGAGRTYTLFRMESLVGRRARRRSPSSTTARSSFAAENPNIRKDGAAMVARKVFDAFLEAELAHTYSFRGMPSKRLKQLVELLEQEAVEDRRRDGAERTNEWERQRGREAERQRGREAERQRGREQRG